MFKKTAALVLACVLVLVMTGCGKGKREPIKLTLSTEDSEAILAAAGIVLPGAEEVSCAGTSIKWFAWYDVLNNYSEDEIVNSGYYTFTEKYGCSVEWIECTYPGRYDELSTLILGGTPPDFHPGKHGVFPNYTTKGMFQAVDEYIDYNDPLWAGVKDFADTYFSLNGNHYLIITDVTFEHVCAYNRRVIEEWGFDDPAELFYNDEWTWDEFKEMCIEFSDPDEDRFALDGWFAEPAILDTSGTTVVTLNPDTGLFESNLDNPNLDRAAELLYELSKNDCSFPIWARGWNQRGGADIQGPGIKDGLCLFWFCGTWGFTDTVENMASLWGDVTNGEIMFVPPPRDPQGDGNYYIETTPNSYVIINGAENPEGVALLSACERFKILDPTVITIDRKQLKEKYYWTDEMLEMYDTCYELARTGATILDYTDGLGESLYKVSNDIREYIHVSNGKTWAQTKENNAEKLNYYIEELNSIIAGKN